MQLICAFVFPYAKSKICVSFFISAGRFELYRSRNCGSGNIFNFLFLGVMKHFKVADVSHTNVQGFVRTTLSAWLSAANQLVGK